VPAADVEAHRAEAEARLSQEEVELDEKLQAEVPEGGDAIGTDADEDELAEAAS
jgi:hypothetical protein